MKKTSSCSEQYAPRLTKTRLFLISFCALVLLLLPTTNALRRGFAAVSTSESPAIASYEILHSFTGNAGYGFTDTDGANPYGPLIQGPDANFYGTTTNGSATATGPTGTVFKINATGQVTILHHFSYVAGEGVTPYSGLTLAKDGNFYGTTYNAPGCTGSGAGCGIVFRISPSGDYSKLFTFSGNEGGLPKAGVIQAKDGYLYGTTTKGGFDGRYVYGGTVYKAAPGGLPKAVHLFTAKDGVSPTCDLLQGTDGALYGTTYAGGTSGLGTVFRLTTSGAFSLLHTFVGTDGGNPVGGLIQATDGSLYGTAATGGQYNLGTVFKIDPSGAFTVIHTFTITEGGKPLGNLLQANDGNLYGTTNIGGRNYGTVFKLTTTGAFTLLHTFGEVKGDGGLPVAGLIQAADGRLYGTTQFGGSQNKGVVFRLDLGLTPTANPTLTPSSTPNPGPSPTPRSSPTPASSPTPEPPPGPVCSNNTCGRVHGNGRLADPPDAPDFNLEVASNNRRQNPRGHFDFFDKAAKVRFRSTSITCLVISGQHATISGQGEVNDKPVTFEVEVDEGRRPDNIGFSITLSNGYKRSGVFRNGRVEVDSCRQAHAQIY